MVVGLIANLRAHNLVYQIHVHQHKLYNLEVCFEDKFLLFAQLDVLYCKLSTVISIPFKKTLRGICCYLYLQLLSNVRSKCECVHTMRVGMVLAVRSTYTIYINNTHTSAREAIKISPPNLSDGVCFACQ